MKKLYQRIRDSLLHLIYPAFCIHCEELLPPSGIVLCNGCSTLLEMFDPDERCARCFNIVSANDQCGHCAKKSSLFYKTGAVFPYMGPAASIIKKMKYGNQSYLAKGAGAFIITQFERMDWVIPDAIVPVPISFFHWLDRGFNQSFLLAKELAAALQVPVWNALRRSGPSLSQAGLTLEQRKLLAKKQFKLKRNYPIADKNILLIDDVITSGSTLNRCAEALYEQCPQSLSAFTFCKTEQEIGVEDNLLFRL